MANIGSMTGPVEPLRSCSSLALIRLGGRFSYAATIKALEMALKRRCPEIGLLHHSDQGCTYVSEHYQRVLAGRGIICSMSRRATASTWSWKASSRRSRVSSANGLTATGEAKMQLFDYLEVFYNQRRRHSSVGPPASWI